MNSTRPRERKAGSNRQEDEDPPRPGQHRGAGRAGGPAEPWRLSSVTSSEAPSAYLREPKRMKWGYWRDAEALPAVRARGCEGEPRSRARRSRRRPRARV